jgi:putative ABC transport system permease protein
MICLRTGTTAESQSVVTKQQYQDLLGHPGLHRDAKGEVLVSPELVVGANVVKKDGGKANVAIRGVGPMGRPAAGSQARRGPLVQAGVGELIVGRGADRRFQGCRSATARIPRPRWTSWGRFECGGQAYESELWGTSTTSRPSSSATTRRS